MPFSDKTIFARASARGSRSAFKPFFFWLAKNDSKSEFCLSRGIGAANKGILTTDPPPPLLFA
ncbi:hypothetical protein R83H12_02920 [Fibrobacteria bacterium R8-3-H12]